MFSAYPVTRTADLDEAEVITESVFALPLRIDLVERSAPLDMSLDAIHVGDVTAGYLRFGRNVRVLTSDAHHYHVNVSLCGGTQARTGTWEPVTTSPSVAAMFLPDLPADILWADDCTQLCLMFPRQQLENELETLLGYAITGGIEFCPRMDLTTPRGRSWLDILELIK